MAVATLGITTTFSVGTTSVAVCATNTLRRGLYIENVGAGVLSVGFGTGNAATTAMISVPITTGTLIFGPVQPNSTGQISQPSGVPMGDVAVIALTTTTTINVTEY